MEHNARMAALALQVLGDATLNLKGNDIPTYVALHNWLEELRTAPEQAAHGEGEAHAHTDIEQQTTQG